VVKRNHPETYGSEVVSISIVDAFADVPVASPVMIDGSELMENVSDETENGVQNGPIASDDTRCPCSSGSDTVHPCQTNNLQFVETCTNCTE